MRSAFCAVLCCLICAAGGLAKPRVANVVSLANEKVYIAPVTDSSSLHTFEGWPKDPSLQKLLTVHFQEFYKNLFAEFKRCEKFGFYEMVEDSSAATVRIKPTIRHYALAKDTVHFPVLIELRHPTGLDTFSDTVMGAAVYRAKSKPKTPLHKLDYLLADFRRHFPYAKVAALFYPKH